jgi:hypothetical protein
MSSNVEGSQGGTAHHSQAKACPDSVSVPKPCPPCRPFHPAVLQGRLLQAQVLSGEAD